MAQVNPKGYLALPYDGTVALKSRPGNVWLGPTDDLEKSAQASVEAAALASATLAASGSLGTQLADSQSSLIQEGNMIVDFAKCKVGQPPEEMILLNYKAFNTNSFLLKYKNTSRRKGVQNDSSSLEVFAKSVTIKICDRMINRQLKILQSLSHDQVTQFIVGLVPLPSDYRPSTDKRDVRYCQFFKVAIPPYDRGTLEDALRSSRFPLPDIVKLSLCRDLLLGVGFLQKKYKQYGPLSARSCFVTEEWRLKIYPGNFASMAEQHFSKEFDPYEANAARLFAAPEEIQNYPRVRSRQGDIYSIGTIFNMIFSNGARPFGENANPSDIIENLPKDQSGKLRPAIAEKGMDALLKLIRDCWSQSPSKRPKFNYLQETVSSLLPRSFNEENANIVLMKAYCKQVFDYMLQLDRAQSHLSLNLGEAVTRRLAESESRLLSVKAEYQRKIDLLSSQLNEEQKYAENNLMLSKQDQEKNSELTQLEANHIRKRLKILEKDAIAARMALVPAPLAKLLIDHSSSFFSSRGFFPEFDLIYKPNLFQSATVLVVSIAGFNRYIQQLSNFPSTLFELLKIYYEAVDNAIKDSTPIDHEPGIYVTERLLDACVLVAGVPKPNANGVQDALNFGIKLLEWACQWDASKYLSWSSTRLLLRIGIHSGTLVGGLVGKVPKLVVMGDTVNIATMVESHCNVQEMRLTATSHSILEKSGHASNYKFESSEEVDLKQRGKIAVLKVVTDRFETEFDG